MKREEVEAVIGIYMTAWRNRDPDLILTIFDPAATYLERAYDNPIVGHDGIRLYWNTKVVKSQRHIVCSLLNIWVDGAEAVAEWECEFDDLVDGARKRMREIAVLRFDGELIGAFREYWSSVKIADLAES